MDDRPIGAGLNRDIATGEKVEADLTHLIERRHERRVSEEGERREEEDWQKTERAHEAARQRALALDWLAYHEQRLDGQRRTNALLEAHHRHELAR